MADVYERARPEYPAEAVDWIAAKLDLRPGRTVLDLGAGTGKLTRALIPTGARVIAVEPGDAMRAELERAVPSAVALRGSAEAIPLGDDTVDAVTVGQAFHWFRHDEAIPELHRVLRRGRSIALVWNSRDHDAPLHQEIGELIAPFVPADRPPAEQWPLALRRARSSAHSRSGGSAFSETLDADALAERIASVSFVAAAPAEARQQLDAELRAVAARLGGFVDFSYVTRVYVSRAV